MPETEAGAFAVGVFKDVEWAEKGIEALKRHGFALQSLSVIAKESSEIGTLLQGSLGMQGTRLEMKGVGPVLCCGTLVAALEGPTRDLARAGMANAMRRVGFQAHDGLIYQTLTARGGVLVAVEDTPRAADALATLHAYGGGNAAIGAWVGRV